MIALRPLSHTYGAIVAARNALYDSRRLRIERLRWPVVSIGNLTVGGSGKTPFVIALVEEFRKRGIACDVLSRGYGRRTSSVRVVNPAGTAEEFGDEPLLIARRTGVPVIVGESRYAAGLKGESLAPAGPERIHILDDGFQHRNLARDFDLVMLDYEDLETHLLPAGRLREPVSSLSRADALAVTQPIPLPDKLRAIPQWCYRRIVEVPDEFARPLVFCGIARAQRFFADLRREGVEPAFHLAFADHHRYSAADIDRLLKLRAQHRADGFLTTEKDLVRLGAFADELAPMIAVRLSIQYDDADPMLSQILSRIALSRS
ncbi:MAG: tetraacyldisaccharide 4'-kinase [Acidobacteriaceae bacterium]